jgi:hypothetical protein
MHQYRLSGGVKAVVFAAAVLVAAVLAGLTVGSPSHTASNGAAISENGPTTCAGSPVNQGNAGTGTIISQDDGTRSANNNVQFTYDPFTDVNSVEVYTGVYIGSSAWETTQSHQYGWATIENGAVHITIPKGDQVLDLVADYGDVNTPTFDNVSWNVTMPITPIPTTATLTAANCNNYQVGLVEVDAEFYDPRLPLVPCVGVNKC